MKKNHYETNVIHITHPISLNYTAGPKNIIFKWAKQLEEAGGSRSTAIALDKSGNDFSSGYFSGTVNFDPGAGQYNLASGSTDIFVTKIYSAGNFIWAKRMGGSGEEESASCAVDANGNVYITGYFTSAVDFDPGPGTNNLTSKGEQPFKNILFYLND